MPRVRNKSKIEIQVFNVKYSLTFICLLCLLMIKTEKLKLFSLHDIRQAEHYLKSLVGCISVARLDVGQYTHMIPCGINDICIMLRFLDFHFNRILKRF